MKHVLLLIVFILLASSFFAFSSDVGKNNFDIIKIISDIFKPIFDSVNRLINPETVNVKEEKPTETIEEVITEPTTELEPKETNREYITIGLKFKKGYNMISIPYGTIISKENIKQLQEIGNWYEYDTLSNKYIISKDIKAGTGYYVNAEKESTSSLKAINPEKITYNLEKGWNLIASPPKETDISIFKDEGIDKIYTLEDDRYYEIETIEPGIGYWILAPEDTIITIEAIPRPAEPETCDITDCTTITTPGYHALCNDIYTTISSGACINIESNDVELDGNGYTITGSGLGRGIKVDSYNSSYIYDLTVQNFNYCFYFVSNSNNTLINTIANNSQHGFYFYSSSNNILTNNTANSNSDVGIHLFSSFNNNLINNMASNNYNGIFLYSSNNNSLINNTVLNNSPMGIMLDSYSNNNTLINNSANLNNQNGIYLFRSSFNIINNNELQNNSIRGLEFGHSYSNNIIGNKIQNNLETGVYVYYSSNNTFVSNTIQTNQYRGIILSHSLFNIFDHNNIQNHSRTGIKVILNSNYNNFTNNSYNFNEDGIFISDSSNNNLINNVISNIEYDAISISSSFYNTLNNNTINTCGDCGIHLRDSTNNTINNNSISNCESDDAIHIQYSNMNNISNNLLFNNEAGIDFQHSSENTANYNIITNNDQGLRITDSYNNNLNENRICENIQDIYLSDTSTNFWEGNTCNTTSPGTHDDYCDYWCGEETCVDLYDSEMPMCPPYGDYDPLTSDWAVCSKGPNPSLSPFIRIYKNVTICNGCYTYPGITIESDNITVDFSNSTIGPVWLENREGVTIKNAQIKYKSIGGIHGGLVLDNSYNNNFENIKIKHTDSEAENWGVYLIRSSNNTFTDITSYGFGTGIALIDNIPDTEDNTFNEIIACCNGIDIASVSSSPYSADDNNNIDCTACGTTSLSTYGGTIVTGNIGPSYCSSFDCDMLLDCE